MADSRSTRIASVVAATAVALASGTNYAFSAWGPEFGKHLKLSATETNIMAVAGNMGMYATGIPTGLLVDYKGPRWGVVYGLIGMAVGYFPLHSAYELGPGGFSVPMLAFFTFLTGTGSCASVGAAIKTATVNWPDHRGTATAFPLAGFGLSAFFFSTIGSLAFGDNVSAFLLMLSVGTLCLHVAALPFMALSAPDETQYSELPTDEDGEPAGPGSPSKLRRKNTPPLQRRPDIESAAQGSSYSERSSLNRKHSDDRVGNGHASPSPAPSSKRSSGRSGENEVLGFRILGKLEFWQLWAMMALLSGVGLMTINNVGNDVKALIRHWKTDIHFSSTQGPERLHVSIISLANFAGRLVSGIGSDILVNRLQASRVWCLVASATIFSMGQFFGLLVENPNLLFLVSAPTGLAYGMLFGVAPSLVSEAFGTRQLVFNWGIIILGPVFFGNVYNLYYGYVYDRHSHETGDGSLACSDGIDCYAPAYRVSLASSLAGIAVALWCIWYQKKHRGGQPELARRHT